MTNTIHVTLPVPPYALSKNGRVHPIERNRLFQQHKLVAVNRLREAMDWQGYGWNCPIQVTVRWYKPTKRAIDQDNATARCSAYFDAAQAAGLIANDAQIRDISIEFDVDKQNPRVEVTFECDRRVT